MKVIIAEVLPLTAAHILRKPVLREGALALQQTFNARGKAASGELDLETAIVGGDHLGVGKAESTWLQVTDARLLDTRKMRTLVKTSTFGGNC